MQRDPGLFLNAAHRMWNATFAELSAAVADEALPRPVRQAADVAVRMKGEFMLPDAPRTEQGAMAKLATALAEIPDLTAADLNRIEIAPKRTFQTPPVSTSFRAAPVVRKQRNLGLKIVLLVAALLMALEALARAGVSVPSVGGVVDRIRPDEPEVEVTPTGSLKDMFDGLGGGQRSVSTSALRSASTKAGASKATGDKNPNHANGRERNQANGRERNQANGLERNASRGNARRPDPLASRRPFVRKTGPRAAAGSRSHGREQSRFGRSHRRH